MKRTLILLTCIVCYLNTKAQEIDHSGIYFGFTFGTWLPDRPSNRILNHPLMFGLTLNLKPNKNAFGLSYELVGVGVKKTAAPLTITRPDTVLIRNEFEGAQFTAEYLREIWTTKHFYAEAMCSMGYGAITYYNPDKDTDVTKGSFLFAPGMSFRWVPKYLFCIQLKAQYMLADYRHHQVSPEPRGNYFLTRLILSSNGKRR